MGRRSSRNRKCAHNGKWVGDISLQKPAKACKSVTLAAQEENKAAASKGPTQVHKITTLVARDGTQETHNTQRT